MDLQEARRIIRESAHTDFINKIEYDFNLPHLETNLHFVGLINVFKFFKEQDETWKQKLLEVPDNHFSNSTSFFSAAYIHIVQYFSDIIRNSYSETDLQTTFTSYVRSYFTPNQHVFLADSSEVDFLLQLLAINVERFSGAFQYFTNQSMNYNSRNAVDGYMLAYEFTNRENSVLFNRRESEKRYVNEIRNKLQNIESNYQNEVISLVKKIEDDYKSNLEFQNDTMTQSRETLSKWLQHNRSNFSNFLGKKDTDFTDLLNNSKSDITSLKNQYGELLKLKEPVTYWKERATELNKKANIILWIIVGLSVFIAFLVYLLLWFTPEGLLDSLFGGDKTKAIRWSFVFVVFISIFFVVIRALLKYMFSNFHLARDAEEREKLTYLFISLRNNSEVSEEEKKIVFQALFSRSDTGLLKEDSSPTMPGVTSIIDKIK